MTEGKNQNSMGVASILKAVFSIVGAVVFIFGVYHGLNVYIDSRISTKVSNPIFLKELARRLRPSVVFDERGSIVGDLGAMTYLEEISVTKGQEGALKVVVTPVEYLGIEPVLEALDGGYAIRAERGSKYDWVFHLSDIEVTLRRPKETKPQRFRLELIR